jgi:hypothetical protein
LALAVKIDFETMFMSCVHSSMSGAYTDGQRKAQEQPGGRLTNLLECDAEFVHKVVATLGRA